jgi:NAD-dependent DNA ligase
MTDAESREVPILTLNMLNAVLNRLHTFDAVESLPTVTMDSLEGAAYQAGGGALPDVISTVASSTKPAMAEKKSTKKKAAIAKDDAQKPAAKKAAKAKREKKVKPPSDHASIARAAMAAAEASKNAHRAIEAAPPAAALPASAAGNSSSNALVVAASGASTALATGGAKARFVIPKPGVNGAISGVLNGKRFVLTGVFPEVGGGIGLNMGKDRMVDMIESFGGKVTGSVSGKTGK